MIKKIAWGVGIGAVVLAVDFADAMRRHIKERAARPESMCEAWCICQCNTVGCGCHFNKPTGPKHV